jgi:uncharacterized protein YjbI with pentapeptide repeats
MKRALLSLLVLAAGFAPAALAQNVAQISAVAKGQKACVGCNLFQADFSYQDIHNRNLSKARLRQADLTVAEADGARFTGADMAFVNAFGARFAQADFTGAILTKAVFVGAYFGGANLKGATLDGADFSGADLAEAQGLTQAQLARACGDASTQLPKGFSVPRC